jgi:hypothetical protein
MPPNYAFERTVDPGCERRAGACNHFAAAGAGRPLWLAAQRGR